jgi:2-haloacid dehalogenase
MKSPKFVTFDCYGTLVKFDLRAATRKVLGRQLERIDADAFFDEFRDLRFKEVFGKYRPYDQVLCRGLEKAMREFGLEYQPEYGAAIVEAVPTFGPYPEVPAALARLRRVAKLVIITNSDDRLIAGNVRNIGVPFDHVVTSQQAGAYKPSLAPFRCALRRMGCGPDEILHVARGFEYDIPPAHTLGWARVWINREGEAGDAAYGPYEVLPDLSGLPDLIGA